MSPLAPSTVVWRLSRAVVTPVTAGASSAPALAFNVSRLVRTVVMAAFTPSAPAVFTSTVASAVIAALVASRSWQTADDGSAAPEAAGAVESAGATDGVVDVPAGDGEAVDAEQAPSATASATAMPAIRRPGMRPRLRRSSASMKSPWSDARRTSSSDGRPAGDMWPPGRLATPSQREVATSPGSTCDADATRAGHTVSTARTGPPYGAGMIRIPAPAIPATADHAAAPAVRGLPARPAPPSA